MSGLGKSCEMKDVCESCPKITFNQVVVGSSPTGLTNKIKGLAR
jgi:hypothetical protein